MTHLDLPDFELDNHRGTAELPAPLHHPARDRSVLMSHQQKDGNCSDLATFCKVTVLSSPTVGEQNHPWFFCDPNAAHV